MAFKQYIFPLIKRRDGDYEIRINVQSFQPRLYDWKTSLPAKNRDFYQANQADVARINQPVHLQGGIGDFERSLSQDGLLTPGVRSVTLLDFLNYTGVDGTGGAINETAPTNGSLLEEIFADRTAIHTIFFSRVKTTSPLVTYHSASTYDSTSLVYDHGDWWELGPDAPATLTGVEPGGVSGYEEDTTTWVRARHTYIIADIKGNTITADEFSVKDWPDAVTAGLKHQYIRQTIKFECDDAAIRLQSHVVRDLFEHIDPILTYMFTGVPAYGGPVNRVGKTFINGSKGAITANEFWKAAVVEERIGIAGIDVNDGLHWIDLETFLGRIAATADFEHSYTDSTTGIQFWIDKLSTIASEGTAHPWIVAATDGHDTTKLAFSLSSVNINSSVDYTGTNILGKLHVAYEWLIGSNPLCDPHVSKMTSDISLDWDAPLSEAAALYCNQFLQYEVTEINQVTKKPILRLLNRRDTTGDPIPKSLALGKDAKKAQSNVSAQHVEINNRGGADKLACPNRRGKPIVKEVPWGAKLRGRDGTFNGNDGVYNASLPPEDQASCFNTFVGGIKSGGHIICTDATVTQVNDDGTYKYYKVESPSIDAWVLNAEFVESLSGDTVGFVGVGSHVVNVNPAAIGQPARTRNRFYVASYAGESLPTGTNIHFAAGYEYIGEDGAIDSLDTTTFHSQVRDFQGYVGKTLYIPTRGIFKILSASTVGADHFCVVDAPLGEAGTGLTYRVSPDRQDPVTINPNGAYAGSLLYVYDSNTSAAYCLNGTNDLFNGTENTDKVDYAGVTPTLIKDWLSYTTNKFAKGYTDGDWSGMYAVSRSCYGLPDEGNADTPPSYEYGNTLAGPVQAWAAELIGTFASRQLTYSYDPTKYADTITDIKLLGTLSIDENGATKDYYATRVRFNEFTRPGPTIVYTLTEQPATPASVIDPKLFPIIKLGSGGYSGGASSVGGSGGSGTGGSSSSGGTLDLGDAVITKPDTATRNRIKSQGDDIPELEGVRHSATSTADHLAFYNEDLATKTFSVDKDGAVTAASGTMNGALDMTTHQIHNVVDPTANQDAATKKYVDDGIAGVSGFVTKTPNATTSLNNVVDQTATTVGLSIEKHASQSANVTEWRDASHTAQTWIDSALEFRTNGTIHVGTNVEATFSINAGSKVTSSATVTGDPAQVCTTKDWVVTLKPDTSNTNIIQATDNSTNPLVIKAKSGSGQDLLRFHDSSASLLTAFDSTGGLHVTGGGTVSVTNATGNAFGSSSSAGAGSFSATNASTAAGAVTIFEIINNGASARGAVSINSNGTTQFGPLDNNTVLTKGIGVSGNFSQPFKEVNANTTLDGTYQFVRADTSGGNVTITLPAHAKGTWFMIQKKSALNTLNINNSTGTLQRAVTANGAATWMYSDGSAWAWYTPT